jgi:nucleotide-binding universal stress UspA family protein
MNTILVPTDFSDNAYVAIRYACHLALKHKAKIILMNSFVIPPSSTKVMINFTDVLEEDSKKGLDKELIKIKKETAFNAIDIKLLSSFGSITEAIKKAEKANEIDLIIMGTAGASDLSNRLFGSNTTNAIKNAKQPILVIPKDSIYSEWNKITFASNIQNSENDCPFKPLKELMTLSNSSLNILSVVEDSKTLDKVKIEARISEKLKNIDHSINIVENDSVSDGIIDFIHEHDTDLLVLVKKNYGFIEGLLHISVTKKLALHSDKPILLYSEC